MHDLLHSMQSHLHVELKKKNKLIDTENRLMAARSGAGGVGEMGEGVRRYKLPVIK